MNGLLLDFYFKCNETINYNINKTNPEKNLFKTVQIVFQIYTSMYNKGCLTFKSGLFILSPVAKNNFSKIIKEFCLGLIINEKQNKIIAYNYEIYTTF